MNRLFAPAARRLSPWLPAFALLALFAAPVCAQVSGQVTAPAAPAPAAAPAVAANDPWTEEDFTVISTPASPRVAYGLRQTDGGMTLIIDVAPLEGAAGKVEVGLCAAKALMLNATHARVLRNGEDTRYAFVIPANALVLFPADWARFRMGIAVSWPGGPFGQDRQRERFLHADAGAPSAPLAANPAAWQPLDLKERAATVAALKQRIFIEFDQPQDGKATIVIEDEQGRRIRNLISGAEMEKGKHRVEWDGFDETGNIVTAGAYRWRAITHPGITPDYLFSFYNEGKPPYRNGTPESNWLSDHADAVAAATFGERAYIGCPISESGHAMVRMDLQGNKTGHIDYPTLVGVGKLFLAADRDHIYSIMEGSPAYEPVEDQPDGTWTFRRPCNILRWDKDGAIVPYKGQRGEHVVVVNEFTGTGEKPPKNHRFPMPDNLAGATLYDGNFYISLKQEDRVVIIRALDGRPMGETKLHNPGIIASDDKGLILAFADNYIVQIDPATKTAKPLFAPKMSDLPVIGDPEGEYFGFVGFNPTGIAIGHGPGGPEVYLSDNGVDQNVKVYSLKGKLLRTIGKKGGRPINGLWVADAMSRPHGIAVDKNNQLWVAETNTFPRRHSVWDGQTGKLVKELFGPGFYGADMGCFDIADHTQWIGGGALWKLDFEQKKATPVSTLYHQTKSGEMQTQMMGHYWNFDHRDGRTFLIGYGLGQSVYELRPDKTLKLWAFCGPLSAIAQAPRWTLPKVITDLPKVRELFAANAEKARMKDYDPKTAFTRFGYWLDKVSLDQSLLSGVSVLWVDKNGDDIGQPDEFEVMDAGERINTGGWGTGSPTTTFRVPALIIDRPATAAQNAKAKDPDRLPPPVQKPVMLTLKPDGYLPSGAPNYSLSRAIENAVSIDPGLVGYESVQDRFGREIFAASPMKGVGPDGKTLWNFPNQWVNVHGSHAAPLPERGVMQGVLYFLGTAPLDEQSEVTIMNGNHGRFFVMTTDGFYLDEMFSDVRVTQMSSPYMIGGECFGGYFGKGEDGKYYLQSGHTDYRVFQIHGLDQLKRSQGSLPVTPTQILAAQANKEIKVAQEKEPRFMAVEELESDHRMSGDPSQWPGLWTVQWGNPGQPFPFAQVKACRVGDRLYLAYSVRDPSPWVNNGKDWMQLFKTGDSIDFQFSCDPNANPKRAAAVPGDKRLLIAPYRGGNIAVLYSYRETGAKEPVSFTSPVRAEVVDRVTELKNAKIDVKIGDGETSYIVTVEVPLEDLGLPKGGVAADLLGDFGVIYGDAAGSMNLLRSYWSNQATGLVNDIPGEITITPRQWGSIQFNAAPAPAQ